MSIKKLLILIWFILLESKRYNSKIGVNLYPLPIGNYTLVMEYFFPENISISLVAQATKVIISKQTRANFPEYKQITVQFD